MSVVAPSPSVSTSAASRTTASKHKVRLVECGPLTGSGMPRVQGAAATHMNWAMTPSGQSVRVFSGTTQNLQNRERDKMRVEQALGLSEFGDNTTEFYAAKCGLLPIAQGYERIVYGDHGPYVEFSSHQICWSTFPNVVEKPGGFYYDECFTPDFSTMLYAQKRYVTHKANPPMGEFSACNNRPEGYANYLVGRYYLSAEVGVITVRHGTVARKKKRRAKAKAAPNMAGIAGMVDNCNMWGDWTGDWTGECGQDYMGWSGEAQDAEGEASTCAGGASASSAGVADSAPDMAPSRESKGGDSAVLEEEGAAEADAAVATPRSEAAAVEGDSLDVIERRVEDDNAEDMRVKEDNAEDKASCDRQDDDARGQDEPWRDASWWSNSSWWHSSSDWWSRGCWRGGGASWWQPWNSQNWDAEGHDPTAVQEIAFSPDALAEEQEQSPVGGDGVDVESAGEALRQVAASEERPEEGEAPPPPPVDVEEKGDEKEDAKNDEIQPPRDEDVASREEQAEAEVKREVGESETWWQASWWDDPWWSTDDWSGSYWESSWWGGDSASWWQTRGRRRGGRNRRTVEWVEGADAWDAWDTWGGPDARRGGGKRSTQWTLKASRRAAKDAPAEAEAAAGEAEADSAAVAAQTSAEAPEPVVAESAKQAALPCAELVGAEVDTAPV